MTPSEERIKRFCSWFVSSKYVSNWSAENRNDFTNCRDRANRCYEAAESGTNGSTHAERIDDFRQAFKGWMRDRRTVNAHPWRFCDAVEAYWDHLEEFHLKQGALEQEIG